MIYDLVVKDGTVLDGTGAPRYQADVGIKNGKIIEIGKISPSGAKVVDAEGRFVAPGFIDIHTHYDAQILWDPYLTCSPWHGATTVVMGNCGFTLAPCAPKDRDYLMKMFARVEGVDMKALEHGLDWKWQTFPDYFRHISKRPLGVNVGTMIGHSAVRRFVTGEAANERQAQSEEVHAMKEIVREAVDAGALGFTTSLSPSHSGMDGRPIPSRFASYDEVVEIGSVFAEMKYGSIGIITSTGVVGPDESFSPADAQLMIDLSLRSGRPINWNNLAHAWDRPTAWKKQLDYMKEAEAKGAQIYAVARSQRLDNIFNLSSPALFAKYSLWKETLSRPKADVMRTLRDPAKRSALKAEGERFNRLEPSWRNLSVLKLIRSKTGKYKAFEGQTLANLASARRMHMVDLLIDWSLDENLEQEWGHIGVRNGDMNAVAEIMRSPHVIPGVSDGGAHTDRLNGSNYTTFVLNYWVRERNLLSLEEAVQRLSALPARLYGLSDRGLIKEGLNADVVVFDIKNLEWLSAERLNDFPRGETRIVNRATGYDYLVVNGQVVFEGGKPTGDLSGKVLSSSAYRPVSQ